MSDTRYMALALAMGRRGMGQTGPNPAVGCVIVKDGRIVGRGVTAPGGRPHAETQALAQAGLQAKGSTVYVTLEPCAHHGQTPPCAQALIDAGVAQVVVAAKDPDPRVNGQGTAMLRAADITVRAGVLEAEANADLAGFLKRLTQGRPFLTLKLAGSFDGRIATATGESQWITGPRARHMVHRLRATHDAVMVGGGTARTDDPALTVRGMGEVRQPARVILSRRLDLPLMGQLAQTAQDVPVMLCHGADADPMLQRTWTDLGATLLECQAGAAGLDPEDVLQNLGNVGLSRVFCEGGGALAAALIKAGVVDELIGFTAGAVIGGDGRPGLAAMGLQNLQDAPRFVLKSSQRIGPDLMHIWEPEAR